MNHVRVQAMIALCNLIEKEAGIKCFRGRQVVGKDIPMPFTNIVEAIRTGDSSPTSGGVVVKDRVDYLFSGYCKIGDVENPSDVVYSHIVPIEQALAKIYALDDNTGRPISNEYYRLGGLITDFSRQGSIVHNPPDSPYGIGYFYIPFSMTVVYSLANPTVSLAKGGCS